MALSSNRIGHCPFTAAMPGSNPAGVTNMAAYSNGKRAVLKTVRRETVCGFESYRCRHTFGFIAKLERQRSANP